MTSAGHRLVGRRWGRVYRLGEPSRSRLVEAKPITGGLMLQLIEDEAAADERTMAGRSRSAAVPTAGAQDAPASQGAALKRRGSGGRAAAPSLTIRSSDVPAHELVTAGWCADLHNFRWTKCGAWPYLLRKPSTDGYGFGNLSRRWVDAVAAPGVRLGSGPGVGRLRRRRTRHRQPAMTRPREMFVSGYDKIDAVYIEQVNLGDLAVAGLTQARRASTPTISVGRDESDKVELRVDGKDKARLRSAAPKTRPTAGAT